MSLKCSGLYLAQFRLTSPNLLASGDGTKNATIIGDVYVHPSAKIHPTAKVFSFITSRVKLCAYSKALLDSALLDKHQFEY